MTRTGMMAIAAAFLLASGPAASASPPTAAMPEWLAGSWRTAGTADEWTEEWWTPPKAGIMLGASRSGKAEALGSFEHMRIVAGPSGLEFCAMPQGEPGNCFKAIESGAGYVTFENERNDYPTRITYRREEWGISAEISGPNGTRAQRWRYVPLAN